MMREKLLSLHIKGQIKKQENEQWLTGKKKDDFFKKIRSILRTRNTFAHDMGSSAIGETVDGEITFEYKVKSFQSENFKMLEYQEAITDFEINCSSVLKTIQRIIDSFEKE
jgi:hypothetical protein